MFEHVILRVENLADATAGYGQILEALNLPPAHPSKQYSIWGTFGLGATNPDRPVTRNAHVAFRAPSAAHVDAFWKAGIVAGFTDGGKPGPRPQIAEGYCAAFLIDTADNRIEAVHRP